MPCTYLRIDQNGQIRQSPVHTRVINMIDNKLASVGYVTAADLLKELAEADVMGLFNPILKTGFDLSPIEDIMQLNAILQFNYGAPAPVISLTPVQREGRNNNIEIAVRFNEDHLSAIQQGIAPVFENEQISYEYALEQPIRSNGYINPIIPLTGDPRPARLATPRAVAPVPSQVTSQFKHQFSPSLLDAAVAESKMTRENVQSIMARFEQESKDSRIDIGGMQNVEIETISEGINRMRIAFERAGIPIEIIIDPELESKGRVDSVPGKNPVIRLNPSRVTEDTAIHEFGHILLDLLGEDNPVVNRAIAELRNTNLYKQVQLAYPELNGKQLDNEVLTTAIGIAGAKIQRKNPNKFQTIVNRIFRALSKLFGVEARPSAVEELAQILMKDKIDSRLFKNMSVGFLAADSKALDNEKKKKFDDVLTQSKIALEESMINLQRQGENASEREIEKIRNIQAKLEVAKELEDLGEFIEYAVSLVDNTKTLIEQVNQEYSTSLSTDQRLKLIHQLHSAGQNLSDFFGAKDAKDSMMGSIRELVRYKIERKGLTKEQLLTDPKYKELSSLEQSIVSAVDIMKGMSEKYLETGIPMMVDLLLEYNTPEINDQIDSAVANIEKNDRLVAIERDEAYYNILKQQKEGTITKEEAHEMLKALNIEQLKNKKITRATLIREFREGQADKSAFSYLMDPIIYSSKVGLQMFATMLKDKMYQANDDTQADIYRVAALYKAYEESVGGSVNPNTFNDALLETQEYRIYNPETGKREVMKLLSFVQPYDVKRFKKDESDMYDMLAAKYAKPEKSDEDALKAWKKSPAKAAYYTEVAAWYAANTTPSPDSQARLEKLMLDKDAYYNLMLQESSGIDAEGNPKTPDPELMAKYKYDFDTVESMINKIYDTNRNVFKYNAVQPNAKYANPKYAQLQANPAAFAYYNGLLELYKEKQKILGQASQQPKNSWDNFSYIAPSIRAEGLEKVQREGAWAATKDATKEAFQFLSTDTSYGDAINANRESTKKVIPVYYVNPLDQKLVSRDLASTIVQFSGMTNIFKRKAQINGAVVLMRDAIENRKTYETTSAGHPIYHAFGKKLKFTKHVVKEGPSNDFKHLNEWIDTIFYGEKDLKTNLDIFGREFSANKIANKLASYTALNNLAFNALQATNQFLIDNVRMIEEGVANQFFSKGNLAWAKKTYYSIANGGLSSLKDFDSFAPQSKLVQAIQQFDALGEALDVANKKKSGPFALKAVNDIPMILQKIPEHETAVTRMFALMDSYRGKLLDENGQVLKNAEGQDANLWDVFVIDEKTGRYAIDPKVRMTKKVNEIDEDGNDVTVEVLGEFSRIKFMGKISGLTKKTNQVKTKFDDSMLQRRSFGKLIMLFRRYFVPSLRRNFGHNGLRGGIHRDLELGTISEGMLTTMKRFIGDTYRKGGNIVGVYKMMEDFEKENVKRVGIQMAFFTLCLLILSALGGDDDEESYGEQFLIYQALRMNSELTQFINPEEFLKLAVSPTATVRPLQRFLDVVHQTFSTAVGTVTGNDEDSYYQRRSGIHEKGDSKLQAKIAKLLPIWGGIEKSSDPGAAAKWFDLGAGSNK